MAGPVANRITPLGARPRVKSAWAPENEIGLSLVLLLAAQTQSEKPTPEKTAASPCCAHGLV